MKKLPVFLVFLLFAPFVFAAEGVEINTASLEQLEEITGIGPALAQRIIDARPFSSVDDLLKVKGIGEKTLQKIKDQGLAYVAGKVQEGHPKSENPTPSPPALESSPAPVQNLIEYPDGIVFTEILPSPEGPDDAEEWIEIFNKNSFEVDLSGWQVKDGEGGVKVYTLGQNARLAAGAYFTLKRPETKITLNNTGDTLYLINPKGETADTTTFGKSPTGQSYNRTASGWAWSIALTPGSLNTISVPEAKKSAPGKTNSKEGAIATSLSADVGEKVIQPQKQNGSGSSRPSFPSSAVAIGLSLAVASAIVMLILKKKLPFNEDNDRW